MLAAGTIALLLFLVFRPVPVRVDMAPVERGPLVVTIDEEGRTRVRERFVIAAPVAGRVERRFLKAGDAVDVGSVVARLYPLPLDARTRFAAEARLAAAEAAQRASDARVEEARATLEQAERSAQRARNLGGKGTISKEERERAELAEITARKDLEAAEFSARAAAYEVEAARATLLSPGHETTQDLVARCETGEPGCLELRSPIRGRVLRVPEESERVVPDGAPLIELGDPSALEIVVDLLSSDAVKVSPGAPMTVEDWGGDHPLRARVRVVEPSGFTKLSALGVEEQRVNVIADFEEPAEGLGDNFRVDVRIVVWQDDDVLKVPSSALFRRAGEWNVFVVRNGRAYRQRIEAGRRSALEVQVLSGLEPGAKVILHPSDRIQEGSRVAPL